MPAPARAGASEAGLSLIELVVAVAIIALAAGMAFESLAARPAQARTTAAAFAELIAEARALAAVTTATTPGGGSGATIAVVRDATGFTATLYAYRPIAGAARQPQRAATPPLHAMTEIALVADAAAVEPPFALFVSAAGHISAQAPFTVGSDAPLAREPGCPPAGLVIEFADGVHDRAYAVSCEMARLDLDTSVPLAQR